MCKAWFGVDFSGRWVAFGWRYFGNVHPQKERFFVPCDGLGGIGGIYIYIVEMYNIYNI